MLIQAKVVIKATPHSTKKVLSVKVPFQARNVKNEWKLNKIMNNAITPTDTRIFPMFSILLTPQPLEREHNHVLRAHLLVFGEAGEGGLDFDAGVAEIA